MSSAQFSTNWASKTLTLVMLQAQVTRFADQYAASIAQATDDYATTVNTPEARLKALQWKLGQATAALVDASGASPQLNALDLLVLASLSRMVVEDHWAMHGTNEAALHLLEVHRRLEANIWEFVGTILTPQQQQEVRTLIQEWRQKNPDQRYVGAIRFREFVLALGKSVEQKGRGPNSVLSLLAMDPLAGLDPTAMAIEQSRLTAERMMYYAQRMPFLLTWQAELLAYKVADQPETQQLLADANRLALASESFSKLAEQVPKIVSSEREAAIRQVLDGFTAQQTEMSNLLTKAHQTFGTANDMAVSVNTAIRSLDEFVRYVSPPHTNQTTVSTNRKPFEVLDYGKAADQIGAAARDLNSLIASLNSTTPQLTQLSEEAAARADRLVQHAALFGVGLIVVLLIGAVLASVAYRVIKNKLGDNPQIPAAARAELSSASGQGTGNKPTPPASGVPLSRNPNDQQKPPPA